MSIYVIAECARQAFYSLRAYPMRTLLTVLGAAVGIFVVSASLTLVDSLEANVRSGLSFLGTGNINIQKWPYMHELDQQWWDYARRPNPTHQEYLFLKQHCRRAAAMAFFCTAKNVTLVKDRYAAEGTLFGVTADYFGVFSLDVAQGRLFTAPEIRYSDHIVILGARLARELFPGRTAVGQTVKVRGVKYHVIGVLREEGESTFGASHDKNAIIPFAGFRSLYRVDAGGPVAAVITAKGDPSDGGLKAMEDELRLMLRLKRRLPPGARDSFSFNKTDAVLKEVRALFGTMKLAGWVIAAFSLLVGGFGISNTMFVVVQERSPVIGLQKALGAKNYFILFQFLCESLYIGVAGGVLGIGMLLLLSGIRLDFELQLKVGNLLIGMGVAALLGLAAGFTPAVRSARMDPVTAMRST